MSSALAFAIAAAILCAGAAFWVLRAYRRASAGEDARALPALLGAALVIAATLGVYLFIGRPALPDAPYAARLEALKQRDPTTFTAEEALAILGEAARDHVNDPRPLIYSGEVYMQMGDAEAGARAYDAALRRDPNSIEAMLGLARAMVAIDEGRVSPEALALFERVGAATNDPAPWIYQAMAAMQSGGDARPFWSEAYRRMAPDDPRRTMAERIINGEAPDASP
ncbi:MAG: hypothetical protein NW206_04260 [Hyphomonadaceae bacterium]|nr:hypothetical protein [Hyphomonadaceae bacterium]